MNRTYLVYQKQERYRSDKLVDEFRNLGEAEDEIDWLIDEILEYKYHLEAYSAEWKQARAALYNSYYIRIIPEVQ